MRTATISPRKLVGRSQLSKVAIIAVAATFVLFAIFAPISQIEAANPSAGTLNPNDTAPLIWVGTATGGGAFSTVVTPHVNR
ncbi:MAG: hypothetical protein ACREBG_21635 [Pyrinomonadaceae bacterium]